MDMYDTHIMIDLETLGVLPGSQLMSIGAVVFGPKGLGAEFYRELDVGSQAAIGLKVDEDTLAWWKKTNENELNRLLSAGREGSSIGTALREFNFFVRRNSLPCDDPSKVRVNVWGNGADFDNALLQTAYAAAGVPQAWDAARQNRCYRTLKNLYRSVKLVRTGRHHNALDDAKSQAEHAVRLLKKLEVW